MEIVSFLSNTRSVCPENPFEKQLDLRCCSPHERRPGMGESIDSRLSIFPAGTSNRSPNSAFSPFGLRLQEPLAYRKRFRCLICAPLTIPPNNHTPPCLLQYPVIRSTLLHIAHVPLIPLVSPILSTHFSPS